MKKTLLALLFALIAIPSLTFALPTSVDRIGTIVQPLIKTDSIRALFFTASSTSQASTFPNASTTNLTASNTLTVNTYTGLLKGTSGLVSVATPGTDYVATNTGAWTGTFDGLEGTAYLARANHTGTQSSTTITGLGTLAGLSAVGPTNLSATDFGSFTCNGTSCAVDNAAISNAMLANSTVSYGGVSLSLGGSDATPAFNLVDATGLPISTGVSGLGTGIATWLATPSSANLDTAVTDNTGSGALVFGTSPSIASPTLTSFFGTPCTGNDFLQDISDTGAFTCVTATGGGGGGGALSTSTDSYTSSQTISYVSTAFYVGGSASTSAEFKVNIEKGYIETASSTNSNASSSWVNVNNAGAGEFGWGSSTGNGTVTRGLGWDMKSSSTAATWYSVGTISRMVLNLGLGLNGALYDVYGNPGTAGSVLVSTGTSTYWLATSSLGISGGSGTFAVGPTSTPMWRSSLQGWTFPDALNVNTDIENNRFHTIKPIWYEVDGSGADIGTLDLRTASATQPFGYNASNTQIIKENSTEQFVTVSGTHPEIHTLTGSSTLVTSEIAELIAFATSTGFTGIELDWEGFADWTAQNATDYVNFVTQLSNESHKYGLKTMIYLPTIWNSCANCESGSGDEWDGNNSEAYFELEYEEFENVPVDYLVIPLYDYQNDYSNGRPNGPLRWQDDVISYVKRKISDHDRIVIGIPAAGYGGVTGAYVETDLTYEEAVLVTGFSGATRDAESAELTWTNGGNSYFVCDDTCINTKRERVEREGINRVSIWHIGDNRYGTGKIEPTIAEPPATTQTDAKFFGELGGTIARFFGHNGSSTVEISYATTTVRHNGSLSGFLQASLARLTVGIETAVGYYRSGRLFGALTIKGLFYQEEWNQVDCSSLVGALAISADGLTGCDGFSFYEDSTVTLTSTNNGGQIYGRLQTSATADGGGVFLNAPSGGALVFATSTPVIEATVRLAQTTNYGTTTQVFIGFTNLATIGTAYEVAPTAGCFFTSSTTQANWRAICRTSLANQTNVDTGIASTTDTGANAQPYRFMIEADTTGAKFYMQTSEAGNLTNVANITTNVPTTTAMNAGVHMGRAQGLTAIAIDIYDMNVGWRKMLAR